MAKLTMAQVKEQAKVRGFEAIKDSLELAEAVQFADYKFAILTEVEGQEVWVEIALTAKQYTDTKIASAFDPYEVAKEWQLEKETKEKEAQTKAKAKADKIAKSKAKTKEKKEETSAE